jgi:hypothetical protein
MTKFGKFLAPAVWAISIGLLAGASPASAQIACSKFGECWHVREYYVFRPEFGVTLHPDKWRPTGMSMSAGATMPAAVIGATASGSISESLSALGAG